MSQRFWIMRDHQLEGPYDLIALNQLPGFTLNTLLCREGEDVWEPASEALKIRTKPVKWSPYVATAALEPSCSQPAPKMSGDAPPPAKHGMSFPIRETVSMPAPDPARGQFTGDFKSFTAPEAPEARSSSRLWILFICLSVINSLYWSLSARLPAGIELTVPLPAQYLPPPPPAIHRPAKKPPEVLPAESPVSVKKKATAPKAARSRRTHS